MARKQKTFVLPAIGRLYAIDPGKHACAVAVGSRENRMTWVGPVRIGDCGHYPAEIGSTAIVELPTGNGRAVPPDDLIAEASHGCLLAGRLAAGDIRGVTPNEWKRSVRKPIHHSRMWGALSTDERALLGGEAARRAVEAACLRGARDGWKKHGHRYYSAREMPFTSLGFKLTHNELDAAALLLFGQGRIDELGMPRKATKGKRK